MADGRLADQVEPYLKHLDNVLVPAVVYYEVYKKIKSTKGEEVALAAANLLSRGRSIALDAATALTAADLSLAYRLAMADAFILAAARLEGAEIVTLDADFRGLEDAKLLR